MASSENIRAIGAWSVLLLLTSALGSCVDSPSLPVESERNGPRASPTSFLAQASPPSQIFGIQRELLTLAVDIPELAGLYVDEGANRLVVLVTHMERSEAVKAIVTSQLIFGPQGPDRFRGPSGSIPTIHVSPAQHSFADLIAWSQILGHAMSAETYRRLNDGDFLAHGVNEKANVVRVRSNRGDLVEELESEWARHGFPPSAVDFLVVDGSIRLSSDVSSGRPRPTTGGYRIRRNLTNPGDWCTLGLNVRDGQGGRHFLTAAHCTGSFTGATGGPMYQTGASSADQIGNVTINPAWDSSPHTCPQATYCAVADVALSTYVPGVLDNPFIAETTTIGTGNNAGSTSVARQLRLVGTQSGVPLGTTVEKTGSTTGTTSGQVTDTCHNVNVGGLLYIPCSYQVQARADGGDSGSGVVRWFAPLLANNRMGLGIVFANYLPSGQSPYYYMYSPWDAIEAHLGVALDPSFPSPLIVSIDGPNEVKPTQLCTWNAQVTNGDAPFSYSWSGILTGTGSSVTGVVGSSGSLMLSVTSSDGQVQFPALAVTVSSSAPDC